MYLCTVYKCTVYRTWLFIPTHLSIPWCQDTRVLDECGGLISYQARRMSSCLLKREGESDKYYTNMHLSRKLVHSYADSVTGKSLWLS